VWWLGAPGPANEPGDYLVDTEAASADRLAGFGIRAVRWQGPLPEDAVALAYPRIALFAGAALAYPLFAYYAMALARLGFDFALVDGAAIAAGAFARCDVVVLPGGFLIWGIDAAERVSGADAQIRAFLAEGGAAVASGGGASYLSSGRPGWTGTARVRPHHTHEYLRTGIGVVSLRLRADSIGFGSPPTLEMPYCHGPVYDELDRSVSAAAVFDRLVMPGHLFIPNPLDDDAFAREMAGHTAILRSEGRRGRAVLFSPNPEMGDLVRKYIAFDGYIARYLPIRGADEMADTLRHYRPLESPSWRLILNAVHSLMLRRKTPLGPPPPIPAGPAPEPEGLLVAAVEQRMARLSVPDDEPRSELAALLREELGMRLGRVQPRLDGLAARLPAVPRPTTAIRAAWAGCEAAAVAALSLPAASATLAERFAEIETAIVLMEAWCRLAEGEAHFGGAS